MKLLKIGELAKATGVTVRSLHHYDAIGLLTPSPGRESGHRLYNRQDVERLQQVISLKSMGMSLPEIARCLDEEAYDLQKTLVLHKSAIVAKIQQFQEIDQRLHFLLMKLTQDKSVPIQELFLCMKEVKEMETMYTPDQLKKLKSRLEQSDPAEIKKVEAAWPVLFKKFEDAMNQGLSTSDKKVKLLAEEAQRYIDLFTGGDKGIESNLDKAYEQNQTGALKNWGVDQKVFDYATEARKKWQKG